eukprot:14353740-Alexandrium_andersonii.AAC.1
MQCSQRVPPDQNGQAAKSPGTMSAGRAQGLPPQAKGHGSEASIALRTDRGLGKEDHRRATALS